MAEPQDMILPLLQKIHAELRVNFDRIERGFTGLDARFDRLDRQLDDLEQTLKGRAASRRRTAPYTS